MRFAYFIWDTGLSGGTKVLLEHVYFLNQKGYEAKAFSFKPRPLWYERQIPFQQLKDLNILEKFDFVITSYFEAVLTLWETAPFLRPKLVHFCQGFEGDYAEAQKVFSIIQAAYNLPLPTWAVSVHLAKRLKALFPHLDPFVVGQGLDHHIFYPPPQPPSPPIKIVLVGPLSISIKNIAWGLKVLAKLKRHFPEIEIVRISPVDTRKEEKEILPADYYYVSLTPPEVADVLRNSHILFSPSAAAEGFGLPALEAMACGLATCLSAIDSYLSWDPRRDYALFFRPGDQNEAEKALERLLTDVTLRENLRRRGREVSLKFNFGNVIKRIEEWTNNFSQRK